MSGSRAYLHVFALCCLAALAACNSDDDADTGDTGADVSDAGGELDAVSETGNDTGSDNDTADPCGDSVCADDESFSNCPQDCENPAPQLIYNPGDGDLYAFPDDFYTVEDPGTVTGLRVATTEARLTAIYELGPPFDVVMESMQTLDGFSTSAGAYFRASRRLNPDTVTTGMPSAQPGTSVMLGYLDEAGAFRAIPSEIAVEDRNPGIVIRPLAPIPSAARAIAAVTRDVEGVDGHALYPSETMSALLDGERPAGPNGVQFEAMLPRYEEAVSALVEAGFVDDSDELAGLIVWTAQSIPEVAVEIAADVRSRPHSVVEYLGCQDESAYRRCTFSYEAGSYRDENFHIAWDGTGPVETYTMLAELFLPLTEGEFGGAPYPVSIFAHGITGTRDQAKLIAKHSAPIGIATLSIDAPEHGDHPQRRSLEEFATILNFFGIDSERGGLAVDGLVLRDSWRAANYDRLALIETIRDGIDTDGDDTPDVDINRVNFLGASLGAVQGPEMLAISPDCTASILAVGGARITDIVRISDIFGPIAGFVTPAGAVESDTSRFFIWLQTLVERGDGANFGRYVLNERLDDAQPPDIVAGMAVADEVVPNPTNDLLTRTLGLPLIEEVVYSMPLVDEQASPVHGNHPSGATVGMMQFDWVWHEGRQEWEDASHDGTPDSIEAIELWLHFLRTHLNGETEIIDPYLSFDRVPPGSNRPQPGSR